MSVALAAALALLGAAPADAATPRPAQEAQTTAASPGAVDLGEISVEGRRLEDLTRSFVQEVAAPAQNRGLARWRSGLCVGVANLQNDVAQYIADRVSTVAEDLGLVVGQPGCTPSALIVAVSNANAFTPEFVAKRPRLFRVGGSGMDRGGAALDRFISNDQPVRWWVVSAPTDNDTGQIAVRLFGHHNYVPNTDPTAFEKPENFAPQIYVRGAARLATQIVDDTKRVFVIVDVDKLGEVTTEQLADYIAFVTLAQIDPDADTSGYLSVLNIFDEPTQAPGLTQWDRAYLTGLYDAVRTRKDLRAGATEIIASIVSARRDMDAAEQPDEN